MDEGWGRSMLKLLPEMRTAVREYKAGLVSEDDLLVVVRRLGLELVTDDERSGRR